MLQYISRPEFGLWCRGTEQNYEHSCNTTEKSTINYATENAVLSLCSMNIAKNHWVHFITLTGACDFLALEQFSTAFYFNQKSTVNSTLNLHLDWTILQHYHCNKLKIFCIYSTLEGWIFTIFALIPPTFEASTATMGSQTPKTWPHLRNTADWMIEDWTTADLLHPYQWIQWELTTLTKTWRKTLKSKSMANPM